MLNGAVEVGCLAVTVTHYMYGMEMGLLEAKARVKGA